MAYSIRYVRISDIECAVARDKRVFIRTKVEEIRAPYTLTELDEMLPAEGFFRTHASAIVQLGCVEKINFLGNHTYNIELSSGQIVPVGRSYYEGLCRRLNL